MTLGNFPRPGALTVVCALALTAVVGACGDDEEVERFGRARAKDGQHLVFNINAEPESLDPAYLTGHPDAFVARQLFEGLTEADPDSMSAEPALASSWSVGDGGFRYRFTIAADARWSDGSPVTAQDFVYSWERVLRPSTRSPSASLLYPLKNARDYHRGIVRRISTSGIRPRRPPFVTFGGKGGLGAPVIETFDEGALVRIVDSNLRRVRGRKPVVLRDAPSSSARELGELHPGEVGLLVARQLADAAGALHHVDEKDHGPPEAWAQVRPSLGGRAGWAPERALQPAFPAVDLRHVEGERRWQDRQPMRVAPDENSEAIDLIDDDEQVEVLADVPGPWTHVRQLETGRSGYIIDDALDDVAGDRHWFRVVVKGAEGPPSAVQAEEQAARRTAVDGWVPARDLGSDASILGVRALDDKTLEVELERPTPYFLNLTGTIPYRPVPMATVDRFGRRWTTPDNIVTSGAFHLRAHRPRDSIELVASPTYRNAAHVILRSASLLPIADEHTAVNLYRAGFIDGMLAGSVPFELVDALAKRPDFHSGPALSTYYLRLRTDRPPFDDPRVRAALNLAVDKAQLTGELLRGGEQPATHFVPPGFIGYRGPEGDAADAERARALLAEAGFPDGKGFPTVEYLYNTSEKHRIIAEYLQRRWHEVLGIEVRLEHQEWTSFLGRVRTGDYQIARSGWIADYLDPMTFLAAVDGSGQGDTGYTNPEYAALLAQATTTSSVDERLRLYARAEELLNQDLPVIPLFFEAHHALVAPEIEGYRFNRFDDHTIARWALRDAPREPLPEPSSSPSEATP